MNQAPPPLSFGPRPVGDGRTRFRLWAPAQEAVSLLVDDRLVLAMRPDGDGWFTVDAACGPGALYRFRLDDGLEVPDPASRFQPEDAFGPSMVVDHGAYRWRWSEWRGRPWSETVLYELHVGACGGFAGVEAMLPRLADLGVTAIELMPVNEFPGRRNWGYDGVLPYAPDATYGTPDELKALVDATHGHGLSILLDVVYNHFGPDGNFLGRYAPQFFRGDGTTAWGQALDFRQPPVRRFFAENALYWLGEYRFDGLRFDAAQAIGDPTWLDETAAMLRRSLPPGRQIHLVLEHDGNEALHLRRGYDAQWNDDGHHALHTLLTGERHGYYSDYAEGAAARLARCLAEGFVYQGEASAYRGGRPRGTPSTDLPPTAFVLFLQNHDQIGNRAFGERLTALADAAALEAAIALQLLAPQIPLIFMGEEDASRTPFLYFTDHRPPLDAAVREGRRREFAAFPAFADPAGREFIPDPNAEATFLASIPAPDPHLGPGRHALYRELLAIRAREIVPRLDGTASLGAAAVGPAAVVARWRLGDGSRLTIAANLGPDLARMAPPDGRLIHATRGADPADVRGGRLVGRAAAAFLAAPG
ncbi:malto-oligosyltrehalose trehalohydrolase [Stella sp.]|uniref:malto-oligosyltrehalose trehalohydrolase n=1 Tax=Stella sp. TaxID=2912054 RepID=UPI0035AEB19E